MKTRVTILTLVVSCWACQAAAQELFDKDFYLAANPDVARAIGSDSTAVRNHYLTYGIKEGRTATPAFDPKFYLENNPDVQAAYGSNYQQALNHFLSNGLREGRAGSVAFDPAYYLQNNQDLQKTYGGDYTSALHHYLTYGVDEGRQASSSYSPEDYLALNKDVAAAYANSNKKALAHYVSFGQKEGRLASDTASSKSKTTSSSSAEFTMKQTISDQAQRTTIAFSGLALMTGNLDAQSFFPPGKVADYTGFQYLRDNDPDGMGHNTSFLTRVANNVIYILDDSQFAQLKALAIAQIDQINQYGYLRFPLMKAFRRLLEGDIPSGSAGLNLNAVKKASSELYQLDGQISFDRALVYAKILNSLSATQESYLDDMKGQGWNSWPDIAADKIAARMKGLPQGTSVAVMTYASDLFSWYAGSAEADAYFCPERQGTYYGSFYMKDAPAIGHEGYSINEQLTATAGSALSDSAKGYVTDKQAALMSSLVATQRNNLYASSTANIVDIRVDIATLLRNLLVSTSSAAAIEAQVLDLSGTYGELDGENNYHYATVFAQVYNSLSSAQKTKLAALRTSIMSGTYADGTAYNYTNATTPYLYSSAITDESLLEPYIGDTDYLFFEP